MGFIKPLDSAFRIHQREHPMHVGGLQLFEPPPDGSPRGPRGSRTVDRRSANRVIGTVPTYRGEGKAFL